MGGGGGGGDWHCQVAWKPPSVTDPSVVNVMCSLEPEAVTSFGVEVPLKCPRVVDPEEDPSSARCF